MTKRDILFIFDYDGTLADTDVAYAHACVDVLNAAGLQTTFVEMAGPYGGAGSLEKIKVAADNAGVKVSKEQAMTIRDQLRAAKKALYTSKKIKAYPGVETLLTRLKQHGFEYCVGSSNHLENLNMNLAPDETDLGRLIPEDQRFCGNTLINEGHIRALKPDPGNFTYAADYNRFDYEDCVVIGDSIQDAQAAKAAGMKFIGFKSPELATSKNIEDLYQAGAIQVVHSYAELEELLFDGEFPLFGDEVRRQPLKRFAPKP